MIRNITMATTLIVTAILGYHYLINDQILNPSIQVSLTAYVIFTCIYLHITRPTNKTTRRQ